MEGIASDLFKANKKDTNERRSDVVIVNFEQVQIITPRSMAASDFQSNIPSKLQHVKWLSDIKLKLLSWESLESPKV